MEHKQHPNAFAYVIYEKATNWLKTEGPTAPWHRRLMFYASDDIHSRDEMWEREVMWRDPDKIRVVPLYDDDANDARRDDNLDAINAQYQAEDRRGQSLASAVETALETNLPLDRFEGLVKTLEAFDSLLHDQLRAPPHTIERADYLPSVEQLEALKHFDH